jgi:hypothetical protein
MSCIHVSSCPLFPLFGVKSSLAVWKVYYCEGDFERCARLKARRAGAEPPANLLPNGRLLVADAIPQPA